MDEINQIIELENKIEALKNRIISLWTNELKSNGYELGKEYIYKGEHYLLDSIEFYDAKNDYVNKAGIESSRFNPKLVLYKRLKDDTGYSKKRTVIYKLNIEK